MTRLVFGPREVELLIMVNTCIIPASGSAPHDVRSECRMVKNWSDIHVLNRIVNTSNIQQKCNTHRHVCIPQNPACFSSFKAPSGPIPRILQNQNQFAFLACLSIISELAHVLPPSSLWKTHEDTLDPRPGCHQAELGTPIVY